MRIDEGSLNQPLSSTAARAAETQRIQADTGASSTAGTAAGADHVDLSGLAGRITQTLQSLAGQTAQRVGQLRQDFQSGRYQPDPQQLAGAMARS